MKRRKNIKKLLTFKIIGVRIVCARRNAQKNIAELCNGSTADSDSVCWGSNPYSAAKTKNHHTVVFLFCSEGIRRARRLSRANVSGTRLQCHRGAGAQRKSRKATYEAVKHAENPYSAAIKADRQ